MALKFQIFSLSWNAKIQVNLEKSGNLILLLQNSETHKILQNLPEILLNTCVCQLLLSTGENYLWVHFSILFKHYPLDKVNLYPLSNALLVSLIFIH